MARTPSTGTFDPTALSSFPGNLRPSIPTIDQLSIIWAEATATVRGKSPKEHLEEAEAEQRHIHTVRAANRAKIDETRRQLEEEQLGRGSNEYEVNERLVCEIERAEALQESLGDTYKALDDVIEAAQVAIATGGKEVDLSWGSVAR